LVAGGCGVALLPASLRALPHRGVVFRPLADPPRANLFFAWHPARMSAVLGAFLESLPAGAEQASAASPKHASG
jgi:DNA-binding transcriptional LysR family regulator